MRRLILPPHPCWHSSRSSAVPPHDRVFGYRLICLQGPTTPKARFFPYLSQARELSYSSLKYSGALGYALRVCPTGIIKVHARGLSCSVPSLSPDFLQPGHVLSLADPALNASAIQFNPKSGIWEGYRFVPGILSQADGKEAGREKSGDSTLTPPGNQC